MVNKDSH